MTNITLSSPEFYKAGQAGVSAVVGYESHSTRVARYSFTAPESGASALQLAFSGNARGNGSIPSLAFYVGTDPDSHADGGQSTGSLSLMSDYVSYSGSAQLVLLPNTTYYVWVFPATTTFGWMHWSRNEGAAIISLSGAATSALTVSAGTLGQPQTLEVTRYGSFTHSLFCTVGDSTETVCLQSEAEKLTWTPPLELAVCSPNAAAMQAVYTIETYADGTLVGSRTVTGVLTVPESCTPAVACTWRDLSDHRQLYDRLLQALSRLEVTVEAAGIYGSTIRSTSVMLGGKPYNGGVLEENGQLELTVSATDSRGRTASTTTVLTVEPYSRPKVSLTAIRVDADGKLDDMGEFARLSADCSFTDLGDATLTLGGQTLEAAAACTVTVAAPSTESPQFEAVLTDALGITATAAAKLSIGYATLDVLSGGKGIAFGTTATEEGFHCAMPAYFTGGVVGADRWTEDGGLYRMVDGQREWLTPPMEVGTEYRTAERCKGKPVFVKLVECSGLDTSQPSNNWFWDMFSGATEVLSCSGYAYNPSNGIYCTIPTHDRDQNAVVAWAYHDGRIVVATSYTVGYATAWLIVKYIK